MKKKNAYFQPDIVNLEKDKNLKLFHLNTTKVKHSESKKKIE